MDVTAITRQIWPYSDDQCQEKSRAPGGRCALRRPLAGADTVSLLLQDLTSEQIDLTLNAFVE